MTHDTSPHPLRFPAYMCNDHDVKQHNDDKREWLCGAQIWAESVATPAALWGHTSCTSRVSQADRGIRCTAHHTVFMNKDAACKAASATQRCIGWAVSSALAQVPASIPAGKPVGTCDPQVIDSRMTYPALIIIQCTIYAIYHE
jgi:hypothetical protein